MNENYKNSSFLPAPLSNNESERLQAVDRSGAMYVNQEELYDIYCFLAKQISGCSVSWTGLIDSENQYCLASIGFPDGTNKSIPRQQTFCQYALDKTEPLIVENLQEDLLFKNHPLVKDGIVKFYAAFPIVTKDGYTLGTLCVSDNKTVKLSNDKIKLLKALSVKLGYQLEIQENFRNKSAENLIEILDKITNQISDLKIVEIKIILKYFSNQTLDSIEKKFLLKVNIVREKEDKLEITSFGNNLKNELSLNRGILKRVKNLSSNENDLKQLFSQIEEN